MQEEAIFKLLREHVVNDLLDGREAGLDASTPLLEWGVINSLEIARLVEFIARQFGVEVPMEQVVAGHFKDLQALTNLVVGLQGAAAP